MISKKVQDDPAALERHNQLSSWMNEHKVTTDELSIHCNVPYSTLAWYRSGRIPITEHKWKLIEKGMDKIIYNQKFAIENKKVKHDISSLDLVEEFMIVSLNYHYNTLVKKHKIKGVESKFIKQLRKAGFDCHLRDTGSDHYVVEGRAIGHDHKTRC